MSYMTEIEAGERVTIHNVGDDVLVDIADRLATSVRNTVDEARRQTGQPA